MRICRTLTVGASSRSGWVSSRQTVKLLLDSLWKICESPTAAFSSKIHSLMAEPSV